MCVCLCIFNGEALPKYWIGSNRPEDLKACWALHGTGIAYTKGPDHTTTNLLRNVELDSMFLEC